MTDRAAPAARGRAGRVKAALAGLVALALGLGATLAPAQTPPDTQTRPDTSVVHQVDPSGALLPRTPPVTQADAPAGPNGGAVNGRAATDADKGGQTALDYDAWGQTAERAERAIAAPSSTAINLEHMRAQLVDWRSAFQGAQSANSARIATLRQQIAALGPAPAEGQTETEELASRRRELGEQLVTLQAPGLAAEEAYSRADGLIREIDRVLRERQTAELLALWPSPLNPSNWVEALIGLTDTGVRLWEETAARWQNKLARAELFRNLPVIVLLVSVGLGLAIIGRRWVGIWTLRVQDRASARGREVMALVLSLGELILPAIGVIAATVALSLAGMTGVIGTEIVNSLPEMLMPVILANWLAGRVFPRGLTEGPLKLPAERRTEARTHAVLLGLLYGLDILRARAMDAQAYSEGTTSVSSYPGVVLAGILLFRMGQLLRRHTRSLAAGGEGLSYGNRLISLLGRGAMAIGVAAPVAGGIGYMQAASALVYPASASLALIGLILVLQGLVTQLYALVMRLDGDPAEALIPVLADFALVILSLPAFALIWGARQADLSEAWTRFREGFAIGDTRISPSNFLVLAAVFAVGYGATRMLQGGLKSSILPRTSLDQGGQNAVVSGVGYAGIILAALAAINAAGIDLSGLAIVAGALSVGVGFGLQNIVSNFVSGIILLIERPVSEGDWIEVGTVQGIVKAISVRATRIQTFDRSDVIVPNSDLISGRVTNWTRFNMTGRLTVTVAVPYTEDSRKVERVLRQIAEAQPLAVLNPPPVVALMGFAAEAMTFEIRVILRDVNFHVQVRSEINHQIAQRFAAEGIRLSSAHRDHVIREAEKAAAEAEAAAEEALNLEAVEALLGRAPRPAKA